VVAGDRSHAYPTFGELSTLERLLILGYAFVHYFEVFSSGMDKYRGCANWLAVEKSVIDSSLRDRFSAGGKCDVTLSDGRSYVGIAKIFEVLHENRGYALRELISADPVKLEEDWEVKPKEDVGAGKRQWLDLASAAISDRFANGHDKRRMLSDIINDPE